MKKLITLLPLLLLLAAPRVNAQIFWVENFESGSSAGLEANTYTGPNGPWSITSTGTEDSDPNQWFVSCAEDGHITGACGTACTGGLGASLHMGSNNAFGGTDGGASYDAGGLCGFGFECVTTSRRAASPTINCTGKYGITLQFYYILGGQTTVDTGWVSYYDGTTWTALTGGPNRTLHCGSGAGAQGKWAHYSVTLPASANNNPNVKIGFDWINDDDGVGTDPSFAIDSMSLKTGSSTSGFATISASDTATCQDSCLTFISTGTTDSVTWRIPGITIANPHADTIHVCFPNGGFDTIHLKAYHSGSADSATKIVHIHNAPHPAVTVSGHTITVVGTYATYQWYRNGTAISGSTTNSYTYASPGSYMVVVDSGGCRGASDTTNYHLGVAHVSGTDANFSVTQTGIDAFTLYSSDLLDEKLSVQVYDATGRKMLEDTWPEGTYKRQFSINGITSGIYFIRLSGNGVSGVLKWLKL